MLSVILSLMIITYLLYYDVSSKSVRFGCNNLVQTCFNFIVYFSKIIKTTFLERYVVVPTVLSAWLKKISFFKWQSMSWKMIFHIFICYISVTIILRNQNCNTDIKILNFKKRWYIFILTLIFKMNNLIPL